MSNIIPFPTKLGSSYFRPRITSASGDWNKVMHLRAHGWHVATVLGQNENYRCIHDNVDSVGSLSLDDAWQAQKAIELGRRYWK